jgi:hypothetical protein
MRVLSFVVPTLPLATAAWAQEPVAEETPFLWAGKVYADPAAQIAQGVRDRIGDAPTRFPDAASCLTAPLAPGDDPIDFDLRWDEFARFGDVEVCLFRVFARLGTAERIATWLQRQGWTVEPFEDISNLAHMVNAEGEELILVRGSWHEVPRRGAPFGTPALRAEIENPRFRIVTMGIDADISKGSGLRAVILTAGRQG